ncbi:MAG TPA: hypothetical protein VMR02_16185 [Terracidiphilus sp.]|nr:hypothetical protein [Terracidiphilus sp.]
MLVLVPLAFVGMIAGAQSSTEAPLPEVNTLVRQAILRQRFAESKEQEYVFREDTNDIRLRKECTWAPKCPSPSGVPDVKGVAYQVVHSSVRHFEIFWRDGIRVALVLPPCGSCDPIPRQNWMQNVPVSGGELAVEHQRVESQVAAAKALRAQRKDAGAPDDPPQMLFSRLLELCTFSNPRRQIIEGRSTILLDFAIGPSAMPVSAHEALLKSFSGMVGIDEEDHAVQHVEGKFGADVNLDGGNIKIRKGTRVTVTNVRVDAGVWLLERFYARGEARYFAFTVDGDGNMFAGNYQRLLAASETPAQAAAESVWAHWAARAHSDDARDQAEALASQKAAQEAQARGYWADPSTGLMWAAKDNGKDVSWRKAMKYATLYDWTAIPTGDWRIWPSFKVYSTRQLKLPDWLGPPRIHGLSLGMLKAICS